MKKHRILAITLARGGSKSIRKKIYSRLMENHFCIIQLKKQKKVN